MKNPVGRKFPSPFLLGVCLAVLWPAFVAADTIIPGGTISTDTTWTLAGSPYLIQGSVAVQGTDGSDELTTLTIEPGVVVRFGDNRALSIGASGPGALVADGDALGGPATILFTTGNASPARGLWYGIDFQGQTHPSSVLRNVIIEYAGNGGRGAVQVNTGPSVAVLMERVTIRESAYAGLWAFRGTLDVRDSVFSGTGSYNVRVGGGYDPHLTGTISGCTLESVYYDADWPRITWTGNTFENWGARESRVAVEDAGGFSTGNAFHGVAGAHLWVWSYTTTLSNDSTWGPAAGPFVVQTEYSDLIVQGTNGSDEVTTLTILPGVTVSFRGSTKSLRVGSGAPGALIADGDAAGGPAPIRFTSSSASPATGDWYGLRFDGQTRPGTLLRNVLIEYAGTTGTVVGNQPAIGLNTESAVAVRLERVTIPSSAWAGIDVSRGTLDLREVSISNTGSYSIRIPGSSFGTVKGTVADSSLESVWYGSDQAQITWTGNTFENWGARESRVAVEDAGGFSTGNTFHGVAGAHLWVWSYTTTLSNDSTWGPAAGPFVVQTEYSDLVVQGTSGADEVTTLTILPGVTVAFRGSTKSLRVGSGAPGALIADGDAAGGPAPIRFTSSSASPATGDWYGLRFDGQADPSSILRNVVVEYAGTTGTVVGNQPAIGLNTESAVAVRLERVTIPSSAWAGIDVSRGTLDLREVSISNTGGYSIRIPGSSFGTVKGAVADSSLESIWYAGDQMRITWTGNTFENWGARESRIGLSDAGAFTMGNTFHGVAGAHLRVCGYTITISKDTTWGPAAGPLVLQTEYNNIAIEGTDGPDGVTTLTILPGTTVAFSGSTKSLRIGSGAPGALLADGDADGGPAPIRFTSAAANPIKGSWGCLYFGPAAHPSLLRNVILEHGGGTAWGILQVNTSSSVTTTVERATIRDVLGIGLYLDSGAMAFRDSTVTGTTTAVQLAGPGASGNFEELRLEGDTHAFYSANATATIRRSDLVGGSWGVYNQTPSYQIDARENWWGDPSGPSGAGSGTGRQTSAGVLFDPWLGHSDLLNIAGPQGGNSGLMTVEITGGDFDPGATIVLVLAGHPEIAAVSVVADACRCRLLAVFDLTGAFPGVYDLVIRNPDGSEKRKPACFQVVEGGGEPTLRVIVELPAHVRPLRNYVLRLGYRNEGTQDMPAQLLTVTSPQNALMRLSPSEPFAPGPLQVIALGHDGAPGVLPPDHTFWIPIQIYTPDVPGHTMVNFDVERFIADENQIDWNAWEAQARPPGADPEAWAVVWSNVRSRLGETHADYLAALTQDAAYLVAHGERTQRVGDLWTFEMLGAADKMTPDGVLAYARDAFSPARGPALGFTRFASTDIAERLRIGPFGRGWAHEWEVSLSRPDPRTAVVTMPGGHRRTFANHRGRWESPSGDSGRLSEIPSGLELRDPNGTTRGFDAEGHFTSMRDAQGNGVTLTYQDGQLARIEHSDGQHLELVWSGERIVRLHDDAGRSVEYGYDAGGELLVSVTAAGGRETRYTYVSAPGTPSDHALGSIQFPGGTHRFFQYDADGKLTARWRDGGTEQEQLAHPSTGELRITDALGATTSLHLGHTAQPLEIVGPLGGKERFRYGTDHRLREQIGPLGETWDFAYDAAGNLTETKDPMGGVVKRGYTPDFGKLDWLSDPNSNLMDFQYDAKGNLTGVTRADGTAESLTYGATGDLLSRANRRGETVSYTYDARGRRIRTTYPGGRTIVNQYDARGRLVRAEDSASGAIVMAYDERDFMVAITYPGGMGFDFEYDDAGRRLRRTDHEGYALEYSYDATGRLERVSDGSGRELARYQYDPAGRVSAAVKGNRTRSTFEHDAAGRISRVVHFAPDDTVTSWLEYAYDAAGRPASVERGNGSTLLSHDLAGQLLTAVHDGTRQVQYSYDAAGNRVQLWDDGVVTPYAVDGMNRCTAAGSASFGYDADGNLTARIGPEGTTNYAYDAENRLVSVQTPGGGTWEYGYNALGQLDSVTHEGATKRYLLDPGGLVDVAAEYDEDGLLVARYIHGLGLTARIDPDGNLAGYNFDALGSTVEVTGPDGTVANSYSYDPYGGLLSAIETIPNPFRFVGRLGVMAEPTGLYHMRARRYDPELGRFLSEDPIGVAGGTNLFSYVGNSPVTKSDPSGLFSAHGEWTDPPGGGFHPCPCGTYCSWRQWDPCLVVDEPSGDEEEMTILVTSCMEISCTCLDCDGGGDDDPPPSPPTGPVGGGGSETITPGDPNEKIGPAGCGALSAVPEDELLPYVIYFENVSTASAPAQEVVVKDQLPAGLDRYSLELGEVAFGDQVVDALNGLSSGRATVPLNNSPYNVDVVADYDPVTGLIAWTLRTIDPLTNDLPEDALAGFLPPNDATGRGEGHVAFTVRPLVGASSGTAIANAATIFFDTNAPIATAAWTNTIDTQAPSSRVTAVVPNPGGLSDERLVTWSGSDLPVGSEVSGYSIHVSEDGGEYAVWIADTTATSAVFRERPGSTYAFFSVARDCLGNDEPWPASADVTDVASAPDADGDGVADDRDNCPALANGDQADLDGDGMGDACDTCTDGDGDGFGDPGFPLNTCAPDNCPVFPNPDQGADADDDGLDDGVECQLGTDPGKPDTDGDGYRDGVEVVAGSNPLDSGSVPAPPQAVDDAAMTLKGTPVTIQVLANDTCAPGVTLSVSSVVQSPSHGAAVVAGAAIVYTPAAGYLGPDSFTYAVTDGVANSGPATVTVSVYGRIRVRSYGPHDGWVLESTERSGRGGSLNAKTTTIRVGDDTLDRQFRGILSFDTSAVPDDAVVTAATLSLKRQGVVGGNPFRTHGSLVGDVIRGAFSRSATLQPGDFQAAPSLRAGIGSFAKPLDGWYRGAFSDGARRLVNTKGRTQVRLRFTKDDNDDRGADYLSIYSGNAAIDLRPALEIVYSLP